MRRRRTVPALLLALSVFVTLAALTGAQVTGGTAAPRLLARLAASLFELDRWTPQHKEELQTVARERTRGQVDVTGLPIPVSVSPTTALGSDDSLAGAIAAAAGEALYRHGRSAFDDAGGATGSMSISEPSRWTISLLDEQDHRVWQVGLLASAALSLGAFALMLGVSSSGFAGALRAISIGSVAYLLLCGLFWLASRVGSHALPAPPDKEIATILGTCAWMGLRNSMTLAAAGIALTLALRLLGQTRPRLQNWPAALDEPV